MSKKTLKTKSFKDLVKYRKSLPVNFNDEEIFRINEPTGKQMSDIVSKLVSDISDKTVEDNVFGVSQTLICNILKELVVGFDDLKDMENSEIIAVLNELGSELQSQVSLILKELVFNKIEKLFASVTENLAKIESEGVDANAEPKEESKE